MFLDEKYIPREKLTRDVVSQLITNRRLLLYGEAGSGKTVLLRLMQSELTRNYEIVHEYTGMELDIKRGNYNSA